MKRLLRSIVAAKQGRAGASPSAILVVVCATRGHRRRDETHNAQDRINQPGCLARERFSHCPHGNLLKIFGDLAPYAEIPMPPLANHLQLRETKMPATPTSAVGMQKPPLAMHLMLRYGLLIRLSHFWRRLLSHLIFKDAAVLHIGMDCSPGITLSHEALHQL